MPRTLKQMTEPLIALYLRTSDWLDEPGVRGTLDLCKRAADSGYNGLIAWDNAHARPNPDEGYRDRIAEFRAGLAPLGMDNIIVQTAYTSSFVGEALGSGVMESNVGGDDALCCLADDRVHDLWRAWAERANSWWPGVLGVMLSYDEMRGMGTHRACRQWAGRYGALLAGHARKAIETHRAVNPAWSVSVWNDMFDPAVNAAPGDYHNVKGGWGGSWDGIDSTVLIQNWSTNGNEEQAASFPWWSQRGNRQVYWGYYDYGRNGYGDGIPAQDEKGWMGKSLDHAPAGICGYVYTTWGNHFDKIRDYYPGRDLIARMKPFPAATPEPAPVPQPPPVPAPPTDPLAAVRAALDELDEPLSSLWHHASGVRNTTLRAALRADQAALAAGVAKAKTAAKG